MSYDLTSFEKAMTLFANRVGIIVNLEVGDKMSPEQAYKEIKASTTGGFTQAVLERL